MGQYGYILNQEKQEGQVHAYKKKDLEKMTLFHLREICRKEHLVVPSSLNTDREGLVRLIMKFRGRKEYRHIATAQEEGLKRIQKRIDEETIHVSTGQEIQVPGTMILYRGIGVNELDGYRIRSGGSLYEGNLLLVDERFQVYTCFYIRQVNGGHYLFKGKDVPVRPLGKHQYFILYFPNERDSEFFYDCYYGNPAMAPGYIEGVKIPLLDIEERELAHGDLPLVIDFGSSNTTMGICMPDGSSRIAVDKGSRLIPSIIGVKEVLGDQVGFVFGQDARDLYRQNYQDEDVTIFYDVKRWVSDANRNESVILKNGYKHQIPRRDMLRAYLEYLVGLASQQFKCRFSNIQLLAPIRQREKFRELFKGLLPEYTVDCRLDEGMAVLFHDISQLISQNRYERERWYHVLLIDCGGGTTDLTSGRFKIDNNRVSYHIDLEMRYENGDTNFGGNNLTYRIMQLLKVQIAMELAGQKGKRPAVREGGDPYGELEEAYGRAEALVPTRFREYEEQGREQYFVVKNNYYYLFELAESIKKEFFQQEFRYELVVSTGKQEGQKDVIFLDRWKLAVQKDGRLTHLADPLEFRLYLNEIEGLLRPEIYRLMERFLEEEFWQGGLQGYDIIKLTGQSCKSSLFTEGLKQYVPGKLIQDAKKGKDGTELKLCCLEGALAYFLNCKLGYMEINQDYLVGALPYEIMAYTHENKEKVLIKSLDPKDHIGYISRFRIGKQLDLYLNDSRGSRLKTYYFEYDTARFERTTQEAIDEAYMGTVIQEETDTIAEGEMKFFVWVSRKRWGFMVLPVLREGGLLYKGKETFFDFEDDTWEMNFFDGRK